MALSFGEGELSGRHRRFDTERTMFFALAAILVWLPIPLGSNRPWAWTIMELATFALTAAWIVAWALRVVRASDALVKAWPAWIALGAWLALQTLDVVELPQGLVAFLSPAAGRIHALAGDAGVREGWTTLSIDPQASRISLLKSFAYAGIFFLVLALANRRSRVLRSAQILVYAAVAP